MSNAQGVSEDASESLYSWGAGWVEYAQQQITRFVWMPSSQVELFAESPDCLQHCKRIGFQAAGSSLVA